VWLGGVTRLLDGVIVLCGALWPSDALRGIGAGALSWLFGLCRWRLVAECCDGGSFFGVPLWRVLMAGSWDCALLGVFYDVPLVGRNGCARARA
jgi:hypothetical protein